MRWAAILFVVLVKGCASVIRHLNDAEYERMPPLSALDTHGRCVHASRGPYCLARLQLYAEPGHPLMQLIQEYSADTKRHFNHTFIDRGICVMETCAHFAKDTDDMSAVVEACVNESIWKQHGLQAKMAHLFYCEGLTSSPHRDWLDWAVAAVLCALITLNIVGSVYDTVVKTDDVNSVISKGANCFISFSVARNWKWLVSQPTEDDPRIERLKALYGTKAISVMITVIVHTLLLYAGGFVDNPHYYEKAFDNPLHFLVLNGLTIVQIFFCVSGFLLVYNLQIASETRPITWNLFLKIVMMRWCRLTPAYGLMIAFTATWLRHLSSGPLWPLYVTEASTQCRRLWWKHLLYAQNYEPGDQLSSCLLPAWHVAVEMQLFVVGLIVYLLTTANTRTLGVMLMLAAGMIAPALHVWLQELDPIVIFSPEAFRSFHSKTFQQLHIRAENNLTCYAIGMFVGFKVYSWQQQGVKLAQYRIFRFLSLMIVPAICLVFYSGRVFYESEEIPFVLKILYAMLLRLVLGLIVAYGIVSFVLKAEDTFRGIFEWRGFVPLGRLSYMVYLLNMNFVLVLAGLRTQLQPVSVFHMIVTYLGVTTLSFLAAVPCFLLVEAPTTRLLKVLFTTATRNKQDEPEISEKKTR